MKAHFFILSIILICLGCELIPEAMDPPADESVRKDYLQRGDTLDTVSYTHLTLPTNREV